MANARYAFIDGLMNEAVSKPAVEKPTVSDKIDKYLTNRILGIPIFLVIMYIMFQFTFTIGAPFQDLIDEGFGLLGEAIGGLLGDSVLSSFIVDGIIGGVGGVLTFCRLL